MALIDSLKQDMRNADEAATKLAAYLYDDPRATASERILWALSVAVLHIIEWILRREKERKEERDTYFRCNS